MGRPGGKLTAKQERFVEEYMIDSNAAASARRAGFTKKNSDAIGMQLLRKSHVRAAIAAKREKLSQKTGDTAERIIAELQFNYQRALELNDMSAANKAVELRGKHLKMFVDHVKHDVGVTLLDIICPRTESDDE